MSAWQEIVECEAVMLLVELVEINKVPLLPTLLMAPHIFSPAHRRGRADHRGGWSQIFGGRVSKPETSRQVKNKNCSF